MDLEQLINELMGNYTKSTTLLSNLLVWSTDYKSGRLHSHSMRDRLTEQQKHELFMNYTDEQVMIYIPELFMN